MRLRQDDDILQPIILQIYLRGWKLFHVHLYQIHYKFVTYGLFNDTILVMVWYQTGDMQSSQPVTVYFTSTYMYRSASMG